MPSTMTAIIFHLTRDEDLRRNIDVGPSSLASNLNSVGEGRSSCVGPAGAAILRNVLVAHIRQVIDTVDVAPVPSFWNSVYWDERRMHPRLRDYIRLDTARLIGGYSTRDSVGSGSNKGYDCKLLHVFE